MGSFGVNITMGGFGYGPHFGVLQKMELYYIVSIGYGGRVAGLKNT